MPATPAPRFWRCTCGPMCTWKRQVYGLLPSVLNRPPPVAPPTGRLVGVNGAAFRRIEFSHLQLMNMTGQTRVCVCVHATVGVGSERSWRRVDMENNATNPAPKFRKAHCAVSQRKRVFLFGGVDDHVSPGATTGSAKAATYFNDMWSLNISKRAWRRFVVSGTPPTPRAYAAMSRVGERSGALPAVSSLYCRCHRVCCDPVHRCVV
jgi:hypothetical protein